MKLIWNYPNKKHEEKDLGSYKWTKADLEESLSNNPNLKFKLFGAWTSPGEQEIDPGTLQSERVTAAFRFNALLPCQHLWLEFVSVGLKTHKNTLSKVD